jgi:hypothetical protein
MVGEVMLYFYQLKASKIVLLIVIATWIQHYLKLGFSTS